MKYVSAAALAFTLPARRLAGSRAWRMWALAAAFYLVAIFHRMSLGVASLDASHRFGRGDLAALAESGCRLQFCAHEQQVRAHASEPLLERDVVDVVDQLLLAAGHELGDDAAEKNQPGHALGDRQQSRDAGRHDVAVAD